MGGILQTSYLTPTITCSNGISADILLEAGSCAGVSTQNLLVFSKQMTRLADNFVQVCFLGVDTVKQDTTG